MEKENCELCNYVKEMTNLKPPICEFHKGIQQEQKRIIDLIKKLYKFRGRYYDCDEIIKQIQEEKKEYFFCLC